MAEVFEPEIAEVSEPKIIVEVVDEYKAEKPVEVDQQPNPERPPPYVHIRLVFST